MYFVDGMTIDEIGKVEGVSHQAKRTDTVLGYRYSVALPEKGLDKVDVRIDGQQQAEAPNGYVEVRFDGLEVFIYWSKGEYHVGAKATGIHIVNPKP